MANTVQVTTATPATGTAMSATMPSPISAGSTAYMVVTVAGATLPTITGFSGWSPSSLNPVAHSTTGDVWLYSRTCGTAESGASVTGTLSVSQKWDIGIAVVNGLQDSTPTLTQTTTLSGTPGVPAITPTGSNTLDLIIAGLISGTAAGTPTATPPVGFTEDADAGSASGGNDVGVYIAHKQLSGQAGVSQTATTIGAAPNARAYVFRVTVAQPATTNAANAGPDQSGLLPYSTVFLDGTASVVTNGVQTYNWSQTSGPTVTLSGSTSGTPTFTAPPTVAGTTLVFSLTVTDTLGSTTAADTVSIGVLKHTVYQLKTAGPVPTPVQLLAASGPPPGQTIVPLSDFNQQSAGLYVASGTLDGNGATYRLAANSSAKVAPTTGTNQYKLIRAGGLNAAGAAKVIIKNLTLEGNDQLPNLNSYGGLVVQYGSGSIIQNVSIPGIPGYDSSPPGETFSCAFFHTDNAVINGLTLDGFRTSDGAWVTATLLGYNYTTGVHTIDGLKSNNARYGFSLAMFQAAGTYTFTSAEFKGSRKAVNIEQSIGGTVYNFNSCDFRGTSGAPYIAQVTSINSSSTVIFRDPVVDSFPMKVNCYSSAALGGLNKQLDSGIQLWIGGVNKTADATKLVITHL
jgi:hypothetical protein